MYSKIKFLILLIAFISQLKNGNGYFFRRWESTQSPLSDAQVASSTPNFNEIRMNSFNWVQPMHQMQQTPIAGNEGSHIAASIPFPIAIQLPHHIIPLAMVPTLTQVQPISKFHYGNIFQPQAASPVQSTTPIPFMKLPQFEQQNDGPYHIPTQSSIQMVKFVPCLCSTNKEDRLPKNGYQFNAQYANPTPFQAIHVLPCYCPVVRELDTQYVQSVSVSPTEQVTSNYVQSTTSTTS